MQGIVDRFEENIVVIETDEKMYNIDVEKIEGNIKEGDVVELIIKDGVVLQVIKKESETQIRKEYMKDLLKDMWE